MSSEDRMVSLTRLCSCALCRNLWMRCWFRVMVAYGVGHLDSVDWGKEIYPRAVTCWK